MTRGFWADRKAAVAAEEQAEAAQEAARAAQDREAALAEMSDEALLAELDLPDPDGLGAGDDFKQFLTDAVPARLKTRALRRLWRVNPIFANLDGLVDYGEDFTDAATVIENMQTTYQVGKGMLKHVEELARQAAEAAEAAGPDADTETAVTQEEVEVVADADVEQVAAPTPTPVPATEQPVADDTLVTPPRRRMQFTFEDSATS